MNLKNYSLSQPSPSPPKPSSAQIALRVRGAFWGERATFILLLVIGLNANFAAAQSGVRYEAQPGSKVKIEGTSTVHDWVVEGQIIRGFMQLGFNPQNAANLKPGKVDAKVEASIPVRSLKSGKAAMDAVMHDAMKQKTSPIIEYHLNELVLKESPKSADSPLEFESKGELSVAGVTNKITMPVTMTRAEKIMKTSGTTSLKMTSFGIKPPAPKIALGFISTGDDVKMTFEWVTALQEKTAEAKSP